MRLGICSSLRHVEWNLVAVLTIVFILSFVLLASGEKLVLVVLVVAAVSLAAFPTCPLGLCDNLGYLVSVSFLSKRAVGIRGRIWSSSLSCTFHTYPDGTECIWVAETGKLREP